jgi:peroxiredoxin Q/BCP
MLEEGQKAPDFKLPSSSGEEVSISKLTGKKVVLYFYPKDNTAGCTEEAKDFESSKNDFYSSNALILGISRDSLKSHCKFIEKANLSFELLSDEAGIVLREYGVLKLRNVYGKESMCVDRSTFLIDEASVIRKIWRRVNVKGHAAAVLEELKKL